LHDYHTLENAIGEHLPDAAAPLERLPSPQFRTWLYRFGLERGYLDTLLNGYIVAPFVRVFRWCDAMERAWTDFLSREPSREAEPLRAHAGSIEELA
jgi:NAD(P)H-quinone oxidoreductase subunit 5